MSLVFVLVISCSHFRGGCHKHHGDHKMGDHQSCPYKQDKEDKQDKKDESSFIKNSDDKVSSCLKCEKGQV